MTSIADIAADIVIVVDESSSMEKEHDWLPNMIEELEKKLQIANVGKGVNRNLYGLVGFGLEHICYRTHSAKLKDPATGRPKELLMFPAGMYRTTNEQLVADGGGVTEDGYGAIKYALNELPLRRTSGIARNLIFISDEDRDWQCGGMNADLNKEIVRDLLVNSSFITNVVLDLHYRMFRGVQDIGLALGVQGAPDGAKTGFKASSIEGEYDKETNVAITTSSADGGANEGTVEQYYKWALGMGGVAWDLNVLRDETREASRQAFTAAFVDIKVAEIVDAARRCMVCECTGTLEKPVMSCNTPPPGSHGQADCECRVRGKMVSVTAACDCT